MTSEAQLDKSALQAVHGTIGAAACAWWDTLSVAEQTITDPTDVAAWCAAMSPTVDAHTVAHHAIQALVCLNADHYGLIHPERLTVWTAAMFGVAITDDNRATHQEYPHI